MPHTPVHEVVNMKDETICCQKWENQCLRIKIWFTSGVILAIVSHMVGKTEEVMFSWHGDRKTDNKHDKDDVDSTLECCLGIFTIFHLLNEIRDITCRYNFIGGNYTILTLTHA